MRLIPLGSGSRGNATYVEFGATRLLVDAGLSARQLSQRLQALGLSPSSLDAILLSHEHEDHSRGAERFSKKYGVPLVCPLETLEAMDRSRSHFADHQPLRPAEPLVLGEVRIEPFAVPHDAVRPLGFVLHGEGLRVGIVTDLGHVTTLVRERIRGCNVVMIEFNHDDRMLQEGPYPWHLKQRVAGRLGHLSNREAADTLAEAADGSCRAVVLAHLSEKNNTPQLARGSALAALARAGASGVELRVAESASPTPEIRL
jgi:phosphoribosyl 1,2-cyclic phosphodiesterase